MSRSTLILPLLLLIACSDTSNVAWAFVSNPSGSGTVKGGGSVIVIRRDSSTSTAVTLRADCLEFRGLDRDGTTVTVSLPTRSDVAAIAHRDSVELRSPLLPERAAILAGARIGVTAGPASALTISLPETNAIDARTAGPGQLHVSAAGGLMILEAPTSLVVLGDGTTEQLPAGTRLDATGREPVAELPDGRRRILTAPPPPAPDRRLDPGVNSNERLGLLGPDGETVALLPRSAVRFHGGAGGLFMTASFPDGLGGDDRVPMELTMAEHNRYLLRFELR